VLYNCYTCVHREVVFRRRFGEEKQQIHFCEKIFDIKREIGMRV